jgi:hypothetical protein
MLCCVVMWFMYVCLVALFVFRYVVLIIMLLVLVQCDTMCLMLSLYVLLIVEYAWLKCAA